MANLRVLLTGGGTGGHIYPLVAVTQRLPLGTDVRYFGDPEMFGDYLANSSIRVHRIASSKWRRYFSLQNFLDIFKFGWSLIQCLWKIFWFMPNVAFSKGGPGALAVTLICRFYRIPLVIHESDAVPGWTNLISARWARKIELAFAESQEYFAKFKKAETNIIGQPVRAELLVAEDRREAKKFFGFDPDSAVVLIIGGSQGAEVINDFVLNNLAKLLDKFQVLHVVGAANYPKYQKELEFTGKSLDPSLLKRYASRGYLTNDLATAYEAADLIVSRAGAGSIFEIAAKAKPSIIIPLDSSANGHQEKNAYAYAESDAAIMLEEANLLENVFIGEATKILSDNSLYEKMSAAAKNFYKADVAEKIAQDIVGIAQ